MLLPTILVLLTRVVFIFQIKWLFNEQPVSGKEFLVSTSGNRQVLSLPAVSKVLAGKISCIAENEAGKATCVATLNVSGMSLRLDNSVCSFKSEQESRQYCNN